MCALKSHLTPSQVFGQRLRELRQRRGWNQREFAERAHVDRTTVNKIEQGKRNDVSISQLFAFADVLGTTPINLLTPTDPNADVEVSPGGRVLGGLAARDWIRGVPSPHADPLEYFFDLPSDEQRELIGRIVLSPREGDDPTSLQKRRFWWYGQSDSDREALITTYLTRLGDLADAGKEEL
jgi:transcriptional regulator with XRE-family HTH domain